MSEPSPRPSNKIDHDDPRSNMYGVLPCPVCGSEYRAPYGRRHLWHRYQIVCNCGHTEPWHPDDIAADRRTGL